MDLGEFTIRTLFSLLANWEPKPPLQSKEAFEKLVVCAAGWVAAAYPDSGFQLPTDGAKIVPRPGESVSSSRPVIDPQHELFTLEWSRPAENPADRTLFHLELARTPLGIQSRMTLTLHASQYGGTPGFAVPKRPDLVDLFCKIATPKVQGETPSGTVRRVTPPFARAFVDDTLLFPNRVLPILVITPGPDRRYLIGPENLLAEVFGLANVVCVDHQTTYEITSLIGKEWSCFGGVVRLYWPGIDLDADEAKRHWIYFPKDYAEGTPYADRLVPDILFKLVKYTEDRFGGEAPLVRQARAALDKVLDANRRKEFDAMKAKAAESGDWLVALETEWNKTEALRKELADARRERNEAVAKADDFEEQFKTVSASIHKAEARAEDAKAKAAEYQKRWLATVKKIPDVLAAAAADFAGELLFLPSARDSAADSPYKHPEKLYELFAAMSDVGKRMTAAALGGSPFDAFQQLGYIYKPHISQTAGTKYASEYTFTYGGQKQTFENHITLGSSHNVSECISVHWIRDDAKGLFVIGHCGRHLTNTKS